MSLKNSLFSPDNRADPPKEMDLQAGLSGTVRMQRIGKLVGELEEMSTSELREIWGRELREPCPRIGTPSLLATMLAGRLQEEAHGGHSKSTRARLLRLARRFEDNPNYKPGGAPRLKPGTSLTRLWKGVRFEVRVTDAGYQFQGEEYGNLSEVAREITGTRWSGPRFFGLKQSS